jgi:hypothetical protein
VNLIHALAHPHPAAPTFHRDRPHRTRPLPTHCRLPATAAARQPLPPLGGSHRRRRSEGVTTTVVALNSPRGTIRADDRTTPEPSDCATRHPPTGDPCHPLSQHPLTGTLRVGAPGALVRHAPIPSTPAPCPMTRCLLVLQLSPVEDV